MFMYAAEKHAVTVFAKRKHVLCPDIDDICTSHCLQDSLPVVLSKAADLLPDWRLMQTT